MMQSTSLTHTCARQHTHSVSHLSPRSKIRPVVPGCGRVDSLYLPENSEPCLHSERGPRQKKGPLIQRCLHQVDNHTCNQGNRDCPSAGGWGAKPSVHPTGRDHKMSSSVPITKQGDRISGESALLLFFPSRCL